ncbi:endothelin-2 [Engraulis encrasicolus]|uniref:endothelin-2 n=1 Tax=Engraulis encrasicolus TaxID=184585 RepID=UPI002FD048EA
MAASLLSIVACSILLSVLLQNGAGLPVSQDSESEVQSSVPAAPHHRVRTKRCSCSNWLDKECIYFCHLDIIWVNTPSKTTPYGLGSPLSRRRRRSTGRCGCHSPSDHTCNSFCHTSSENPALVIVSPEDRHSETMGYPDNDLLTLLRQVVSANQREAEEQQSSSPRRRGSRQGQGVWPQAS